MSNALLNPSDVNGAVRLVLIAERCGPEFLDNTYRFDQVIGPGRFAGYDSGVIDLARSIVRKQRSPSLRTLRPA
jgi:hypothetical protein